MANRTDLLVIGAGPYAYSAAAFARHNGIEVHLVGSPMAFWREHMPADMYLRSGADWHLDANGQHTFVAFFEDRGMRPDELRPIPIGTFLEYTEWFRERESLDVDERLVQDLAAPDGHFVATLDDGSTIASFFFNDTATTEIYTLSLHDALPISLPTAPTRERPDAPVTTPGKVGEHTERADGVPKVKGEFEYSSDLWMDGMLWGATLRSPHPHANIWSIDTSEAEEMPGVYAVLTHEDVPGRKVYGMEVPDQPVLAWERVRYQGEPVAVVAADHPETARRALEKISVKYEILDPLTDPEEAMKDSAPQLHLSGNVLKRIRILHGDVGAAKADVVVTGEYEIGMQDQAFLGPESGLAVPDGQGGVDLYISTQWLHIDQDQVAESLGLNPEQVRLTLSGVGGAFGGREDLSMQIHACMLALDTGRPVKMMYNREESFFGHVHRHPARLRYEHGATRDGELVYVKARIVLDGGAYASSSTAVCSNAASFSCGPYYVPNALIDAYMVYTNNPPCGAMRGFGAVQACFAHEAQMDKLAEALEMDPVELRIKNAIKPGDTLPFGQEMPEPAPVA